MADALRYSCNIYSSVCAYACRTRVAAPFKPSLHPPPAALGLKLPIPPYPHIAFRLIFTRSETPPRRNISFNPQQLLYNHHVHLSTIIFIKAAKTWIYRKPPFEIPVFYTIASTRYIGSPCEINLRSYSVTILPSKSELCKSSDMFCSTNPAFEYCSSEYSKKCILSVF